MFEQLASSVWHLRLPWPSLRVVDSSTDREWVFEFVTAFYIVFLCFSTMKWEILVPLWCRQRSHLNGLHLVSITKRSVWNI